MSTERSGHARSFDAAAALYAAARPGYPGQALRWLVPERTRRVLDLGAGTGKLTRLLVEAGFDVVAVEPSPQMLAELRTSLPTVEAHEAPAEEIPVPDADVDLVLVAQAFHWFDAEPAMHEIARVLRPGGRLGMLWNSFDDAVPWASALADLTGSSARTSMRNPRIPDLPELFTAAETIEVAHLQRTTPAGLRDLIRTHSFFLVLAEEEQRAQLAAVERLLAEHPDLAGREVIDVPYQTLCWRTDRH